MSNEERRITNDQEALAYIKKALEHSGYSAFDSIEIMKLPKILEAYDAIDELDQEDADYIISMIIENYDKIANAYLAKLN
jgi:hypothetical protein